MQLAEINIARLTHEIGHPAVAEFTDNLDRVNGIAERMDGFVWRYVDESGNATDTQIDDDPRVIVNVSVWRDAPALESFVWGTLHKQFYAKRDQWFHAMDSMAFAMWWVNDGHRPDVNEAMARLHHLNTHGPSDHAFGWDHLKEATQWRTARCAPLAAE
jgi:heme-degrading monooxygenase HmoA